MRIVIAGAGIVGLSVAHALTRRGHCPTVIAMDQGFTASGAGIVSSQFWIKDLAELARRSQEIIQELVPVNRCGMAQIALSETQARLLKQVEGACEGIPDSLKEALSPQLIKRIEYAIYSIGDFWVSPPDLLAALARDTRILQARIDTIDDGMVHTSLGDFPADYLILAMGPWAKARIDKHVTQLARVQAPLSTMVHILDTGIYLRPEGRGALAGDGDTVWVGEPAPQTVTPAFLAHMDRELAFVLRRPVKSEPVSAGIIATTPDQRPIVRGQGRNWILTGFGGDGLALAPALGEQVAEQILQA